MSGADLFIGTHAENMRDAHEKGRLDTSQLQRRGEWTHCKRGHEFTPENTYVYPNGTRECRICRKRKNADFRARRKAQREAFTLDWDEVSGRRDPRQQYRLYRVGSDAKPELIATTDSEAGVGVALCTLAREGEFENSCVGVLDAMGEKGQRWLSNPWSGLDRL